MAALEKDVNNHRKHYHYLIQWIKYWGSQKRRKPSLHGNAFDLCDLFCEGSSVAHAIWAKYEDRAAEKEESAQTDNQQLKSKISALIAEIYGNQPADRVYSREEVISYLKRVETSAV